MLTAEAAISLTGPYVRPRELNHAIGAFANNPSGLDQSRVEFGPPGPGDTLDGPDPAVLLKMGRLLGVPILRVEDREPALTASSMAPLTAALTASPPCTYRDPLRSAKSFWQSTMIRAVRESRFILMRP